MAANSINYTRNSNNDTSGTENKFCDSTIETTFFVLYSVIGFTIFVGNSFACVVFLTNEKLRRNKMNVFLVSLAVWDIFMSVLVVPFYGVYCGLGCEYSLIRYCWLMRGAKDFVKIGSTLNFYAITYDRYLAVLRPLEYQSKLTSQKVTAILALVWLLPVFLAGIRNAWQHSESVEKVRFNNKMYDSAIVLGFVVLLVVVMLITNVRIMRAIKTQIEREKREFPNNTGTAQRHKGTIACVIVVLVFVICWLPRAVYNFSFVIDPPGWASPLFFRICFLFLFVQSSVNPFIYWFYRVEFRQAALSLIQRQRFLQRTAPFLTGPRTVSFLSEKSQVQFEPTLDFPTNRNIQLTFYKEISDDNL